MPLFTYVASQTLDGIVAHPDRRTAQIIIKVFMVSSPVLGCVLVLHRSIKNATNLRGFSYGSGYSIRNE
nr:MAG TPA: hypothetical protein [Caudoviricetes sp.]